MSFEPILSNTAMETDYISYNVHNWSYTIAFVLSSLGTCYIMMTLFLLKLFSNPLSRMIFFISLCDLIINITMIRLYSISHSELNESRCRFYVGIAHYIVLSSFCWATCFTHAFYKVVQEHTDHVINSKMKIYFAISVLLPVPLAILADVWDFVEYSPQPGRLCYHKLVHGAIDKSFFYTENIPFAIALALSFYFCLRSVRLMHQMDETKDRLRFLYIMQFPIILLICWFGQQLNVIFAQLGLTLPLGKTIGVMFQTLIYLQGFINAIVYGVSYRVLAGYKELYKKHCRNRASSNSSGTKKLSLRKITLDIDSQESASESDTDGLEAELYERAKRKKTQAAASMHSMPDSLSSLLLKNNIQ